MLSHRPPLYIATVACALASGSGVCTTDVMCDVLMCALYTYHCCFLCTNCTLSYLETSSSLSTVCPLATELSTGILTHSILVVVVDAVLVVVFMYTHVTDCWGVQL